MTAASRALPATLGALTGLALAAVIASTPQGGSAESPLPGMLEVQVKLVEVEPEDMPFADEVWRALVITRLLDAIWAVESGRATKAPRGDGGRSRGPLQISRAYWEDSRVPGAWADCEDLAYSRRVVAAYMRRHCPDAWRVADAQTIARIHCGGPDGAEQDCTLPYWRKVRAVMERER